MLSHDIDMVLLMMVVYLFSAADHSTITSISVAVTVGGGD
jgi:hypothetical protein